MRIARVALFFIQFSFVGLGIALLILVFEGTVSTSVRSRADHDSYAVAVQRAAPTVVSIHTATTVAETANPLFKDPVFREIFRIPATPPASDLETSLGSGVIVDSQQANETISGLRPGTSVSIVASRRGEKRTFDTMVAKRPARI